MVRAVVLVKSPKRLIAARLRKIGAVSDSFAVSGQFDAVAVIEVDNLEMIKQVAKDIQEIAGVDRTETLVELSK